MNTEKLIIILSAMLLAVSCQENRVPDQDCCGTVVETMGGHQVTDFVFDGDGYVWMRCGNSPYVFKTDGDNIIRYGYENDRPGSLSSNKINDIIADSDGVVWIATQKGVDMYDTERGCFKHFVADDYNSYIISIGRSRSGRTCIVTRRNILELDDKTGMFVRKLEMPFINSAREPDIFFDTDNRLWVRYGERLDCFDDSYSVLFSLNMESASTDAVYDGAGSVWYSEGQRTMVLDTRTFSCCPSGELYPALNDFAGAHVTFIGHDIVLIGSAGERVCVNVRTRQVISSKDASGILRTALNAGGESTVMSIGPNGGLWRSSARTGFVFTPPSSDEVYSYENLISNLQGRNIRAYAQDAGYFWFLDDTVLGCYDIRKRTFVGTADLSGIFTDNMPFNLSLNRSGQVLVGGAPRRHNPTVVVTVGDNALVTSRLDIDTKDGMVTYGNGDDIVFAGTGARISVFDSKNSKVRYTSPAIFNDNACYASMLRTLYDESVLVCFTDHQPVIFNSSDDSVSILRTEDLRQVYFSTFAQDLYGNLWLGSTDNGLFMCRAGSDELVRVPEFLGPEVTKLASDRSGHVFVMDISGNVYLFDASTIGSHKVWIDSSDYPPERFLITMPDGDVALTGPSAYMCFNVKALSPSNRIDAPMHVLLTSGNKVVSSFRTDSYPSRTALLRLDRKTEGLNLNIGFVHDKDIHSTYSYIYEIKGLKGQRRAYRNKFIPLYGINRPSNNVTFHVHNNNLGTDSEPFTIKVRMNLLWYEIALPVVIVVLVVLSLWMLLIFYRKKREADSERLKREMTERMNMDNIDFFANISHEFRTPLTLINGAAALLGSGGASDSAKAKGVIKRNTDRLLKLVSQMLDFNKLDHGVLELNVRLEHLSDIFEDTRMSFEIGARMKSISLVFNTPSGEIEGWVDRDKIEKVMYNLCSNALKYTPPGGTVTVDASVDSSSKLHVSVSDTGVGIQEEDIEAVFDRFYQGKEARKSGGTGIGLYYSKALVNLHHGSIGARQRKNAEDKVIGTVFYFSVPMDGGEYSQKEKSVSSDTRVGIDRKSMMSEYVEDSPITATSEKKPKLMIIDDDYEVVYYLKSIFSERYNVFFRFDAMSGYKMIEEASPDVVICDVMMVDVDGIELCRMVKNNISMSHIPIIMLTAKSTLEDQITSLGAGADAYVVKPFNPEYLQALVKSMIDNRNRVRKMLGSSTTVATDPEYVLSGPDREFMERMYSAMEESLRNGELDIDSVASQLGVSRSKFYYKVKALTGQTPNEFFTTYKLNYSVKYLKERKYKIAAIAEMLGFSSASHFTAQFKKKFGMLPSQYSDNETNNQ